MFNEPDTHIVIFFSPLTFLSKESLKQTLVKDYVTTKREHDYHWYS